MTHQTIITSIGGDRLWTLSCQDCPYTSSVKIRRRTWWEWLTGRPGPDPDDFPEELLTAAEVHRLFGGPQYDALSLMQNVTTLKRRGVPAAIMTDLVTYGRPSMVAQVAKMTDVDLALFIEVWNRRDRARTGLRPDSQEKP